jgi:NhaP-type Na+/H+ or K+/H+ antiporter
MPKRLHMLLGGESLFNDGTTVVFFSLVTGLAVENTIFRPFATLLHFAWAIIVAIPVGMLLGWACARLLKYWHEQHMFFTTSISLVLAYGALMVSETLLHISGIITALVAAIAFVKGIAGERSAETRFKSTQIMEYFWD